MMQVHFIKNYIIDIKLKQENFKKQMLMIKN